MLQAVTVKQNKMATSRPDFSRDNPHEGPEPADGGGRLPVWLTGKPDLMSQEHRTGPASRRQGCVPDGTEAKPTRSTACATGGRP